MLFRSQINLNGQIDATDPSNSSHTSYMGTVLNNLSKAIAMREPYKSEVGDNLGPLKGLGNNIITKRNNMDHGKGFLSKFDILGTYDGTEITREDLKYVWDYITVYPTVDEMKENSLYKTMRSKNPKSLDLAEEKYEKDYRCPVNINTASWPVLVALFVGLEIKLDISTTVRIDIDEAKILANRICIYRKNNMFTTWDKFYEFLNNERASIFESNHDYKVDIIKANFDPNVTLRWFNPDAPVYQRINKTDLIYYTTEFCFFPTGQFEITSLGQIIDFEGVQVGSSIQYSMVRAFDILYYTSQREFEGGSSDLVYPTSGVPDLAKKNAAYVYDTTTPKYEGYNAFSYANNLQKAYTKAGLVGNTSQYGDASEYFGYLLPLGYNLKVGEPFGTTDGPYLFRADFNGTYSANLNTSGAGPNEDQDSLGLLAAPNNTSLTKGNLAADEIGRASCRERV